MNKTKDQWENEIIEIAKNGYLVSMWWIEENKFRRPAIKRLIKKRIILEKPCGYPMHSFRLCCGNDSGLYKM